jgi:flagellar biosynthesis/type III secretory pathway M-ring protein FliF/YscJ
MRRGISLTIAVACAVAVAALPGVATPGRLAGRVAARPAPASSPPVTAAGASLQERLNALLDSSIGRGRAAVTVNAIVDRNRVNAQSLRYARRGVALQSQSARTRTAGYSARSTATAWAHSATLTSTVFATGGVRQLHIGLMVSTTVPRAAGRRLARTIAVAAGLNRARGDTLAVTRTRFASPRRQSAAPFVPPTALRWALLALGVLAFLFTLTPTRHETALI